MTQMTLCWCPERSRATAIPRPAESTSRNARRQSSRIRFRAFREAGKATAGAYRPDAVAAAGQNFVWVGLVADVPNQLVGRGVEDMVERDGQLDDAKAGAKMPTGDGDSADCLGAQFVGNLLQVLRVDEAQVRWRSELSRELRLGFGSGLRLGTDMLRIPN